jgi:type IV pilus assembly protein PilC
MQKFVYKGTNSTGGAVEEVVEAADRYAVYDIARRNGHVVSSIEAVKPWNLRRLINVEKINYFLSRVKRDELVMLTRNLSSMLKAGLPLSRALSVIERQSKNPRLKGVMKGIRESINKGDQFFTALKVYPETFSPLYVAMVRAGEESGGLSPALQTIAMQLERSSNLRKKIKGAMIYPAIVITVMIIIGILMMIFVIPTIASTFENIGNELPATTKFLIGTSNFLVNNGLLAALGAIGIVVAFIMFARTAVGKKIIHRALLYIPVIGTLVKQTNSAYTARTLSSLLTSGVDVIGALNITEDVLQNVHYKAIIREAAKGVEKGNALSLTFIANEKLYPILVGEMISVGEETGQISNMLSELAIFYETEVEQKTKDLSTIIEPMLMVVIGATVGFFALAMIAPIYSITDSM